MKQESHSSSSSSSRAAGEIPVRQREDATNSDISPVQVSNSVDDGSGQPDEIQANKTSKTSKREPRWNGATRQILTSRNGCKNSRKIWWMMKFHYSHASSSHEASLEPTTKRREDLGKHSVHTHFPKDRNCEICKKDENFKGSVQKTQWRSRTSSCKLR